MILGREGSGSELELDDSCCSCEEAEEEAEDMVLKERRGWGSSD
jgi:hypothetical protein